MMTSRERIMAVLKKQKPDMIPNSPRIWAWLMERYGKPTYLSYLDLKEKYFDYDPIITIPGGFPNFMYTQFEDHACLSDVKVEISKTIEEGKTYVKRKVNTPCGELTDLMVYAPAGKEYGISPMPEKLEPLIKSRDDLEKVKYLLPGPEKFASLNSSDYASVKKAIGENGFMEVRPNRTPDNMLVDAVGFTNSLILSNDDIELFKDILKTFHDYYKKYLIFCLDNGVEMIFESWYNASMSSGWSPEIYRECFLPIIKEDAEITHSYGAFYHFYDDGKIMPVIDQLKEAKIDLISTVCPPPSGDVDVVKIKEILGNTTALNGYIDLVTIRFGNPEEIENQVKHAIETLGKDGGYVLGTSDSIRDGSPFENVKAYFDAARKYGKC